MAEPLGSVIISTEIDIGDTDRQLAELEKRIAGIGKKIQFDTSGIDAGKIKALGDALVPLTGLEISPSIGKFLDKVKTIDFSGISIPPELGENMRILADGLAHFNDVSDLTNAKEIGQLITSISKIGTITPIPETVTQSFERLGDGIQSLLDRFRHEDPATLQRITEMAMAAATEMRELTRNMEATTAAAKLAGQGVQTFASSGMRGASLSLRQMGTGMGRLASGMTDLRGAANALTGIMFLAGDAMLAAGGKFQKAQLMMIGKWAGIALIVNLVVKAVENFQKKIEDMAQSVADTAKAIGKFFGDMAKSISVTIYDKATEGIKAFATGIATAAKNIFGFEANIKRLGKGIVDLSNKLTGLAKSTLVFKQLEGGVRSVISVIERWLGVNEQFNLSLNMIKVNILTAFYEPIQAVLPLLYTFMNVLAQVTAYLAHFVALLFGSTYAAARNGAKAMYDLADGFKAAGGAAKKMFGNLPFDELNTIADAAGGGGADLADMFDFDFEPPEFPKWLEDLAGWLKKTFEPVWDSLKKAWDALLDSLLMAWERWGDFIIAAWKRATESIAKLLETIFRDFARLFKSAEWRAFLDEFAKTLIFIADLVTAIATAFRKAWVENDRGLDFLKSFAILWRDVLALVNSLIYSFTSAWNAADRGQRIAAHILEIWTNINVGIGNLARNISKAWDSAYVGQRIWANILDIIERLLFHFNRASEMFRNWADGLNFTPLLSDLEYLTSMLVKLTDVAGGRLVAFFNDFLAVGKSLIEVNLPKYTRLLGDGFKRMAGDLKRTTNIFEFVGTSIIGLADTISNVLYAVISDINWNKLGNQFASGLQKIFDPSRLSGISSTLARMVHSILDTIKGFISNFDFRAAGKALGDAVRQFISDVKPSDVADTINSLIRGILKFFNEIPTDQVKDWAKQIINAIDWDAALALIGEIDAIKKIPEELMKIITGGIGGIGGKLFGAMFRALFTDIGEGIVADVQLVAEAVDVAFGGMFSSIDAHSKEASDALFSAKLGMYGISEASEVAAIAAGNFAIAMERQTESGERLAAATDISEQATWNMERAQDAAAFAADNVVRAEMELEAVLRGVTQAADALSSSLDAVENAKERAAAAAEALSAAEIAAGKSIEELIEHMKANDLTALDLTDTLDIELLKAYSNNVAAIGEATAAEAAAIENSNTLIYSKEAEAEAIENVAAAYEEVKEANIEAVKAAAENAKATMEQREAAKEHAIATNESAVAQKELETAQANATRALLEMGNALDSNGGKYANQGREVKEYRDAVIDMWESGQISAEDARLVLENVMKDMSERAQKSFGKEIPEAISDGLAPEHYEENLQEMVDRWSDMGDAIYDKFEISSPSGFMVYMGEMMGEGAIEGVESKTPAFLNLFEEIHRNIAEILRIDRFREIANLASDGLIQSVTDKTPAFLNLFENMHKRISEILKSSRFKEIGVRIGEGLNNGIKSMEGSIMSTVQGIADAIAATFAAAMQISSPSKLFAYFGEMLMEGLGAGLEDEENSTLAIISDIGEDVGLAFLRGLESTYERIMASVNGLTASIGAALSGISASITVPTIDTGRISQAGIIPQSTIRIIAERGRQHPATVNNTNDNAISELSSKFDTMIGLLSQLVAKETVHILDGERLGTFASDYADRRAFERGDQISSPVYVGVY